MSGNTHERKLATFLKEVANMRYDEFVRAEKDLDNYTTAEGMVFALVRACVMEQLPAIKLAINRLDGKLSTPVHIIYPKVYYIFPQAKSISTNESQKPLIESTVIPTDEGADIHIKTDDGHAPYEVMLRPAETGEIPEEGDLPTLTFRETLAKMVDYKRSLPRNLADRGIAVDQWLSNGGPEPPLNQIPMVKSVVAAHLLIMAQRRDIDALYEVFDSIDGKLVETFEVVGDDMYIAIYSDTAPLGAEKNQDGIYQIEATQAQKLWTQKLGGTDENEG